MSLTCPLVNDTIGSSFDAGTSLVYFLDQTSSGAVSCTQYYRYQTSSSVSGMSSIGSYPSGSGNTNTYTSSTPTKMTFSSTLGPYDIRSYAAWAYFACTIPASTTSGVVAYYTEEL